MGLAEEHRPSHARPLTASRAASTLPVVPAENRAAPGSDPDQPRPEAPAARDAADAMLVCPNCGRRLTERKCKLLCPNPICGYYLSCSDFY